MYLNIDTYKILHSKIIHTIRQNIRVLYTVFASLYLKACKEQEPNRILQASIGNQQTINVNNTVTIIFRLIIY
jgi:hypothetical protein